MNIEPTPEQIGAAKKLRHYFDMDNPDADELAEWIAARDAEKDRVIKELRKELERNDEEHEGFERANISNRLRAEQAEAEKARAIAEMQMVIERLKSDADHHYSARCAENKRAERAEAAKAMMAKELDAYADMCEGTPFEHKPIMGSNQQFSECIGCRAKAVLLKIKTTANPQ